MAIFLKLWAIYQAIRAGDYKVAVKLFWELINETFTAEEHKEAELMMMHMRASAPSKK